MLYAGSFHKEDLQANWKLLDEGEPYAARPFNGRRNLRVSSGAQRRPTRELS